ncbi:MAG: GWxTD domain-containing protein [Bacteroidetes bacterium]|nr:GWxTD domain-containing protein [Bacteroidota bacterium]
MRSLVLVVAIVLLAPSAQGQRHYPASSFLLNLDYARFRNDDRSGYLELYYAFYPNLVTCDPTPEGGLQGWVVVTEKLTERATGDQVLFERRYLTIRVRDTSQLNAGLTSVSQAGYALPFGSYQLTVSAVDSLNPTRQDSISLPIEVVPVGPGVSVSDLELCSSISTGKEGGAFIKNTLEVVPNATLVFGVTSHPVLFHYAELYQLSSTASYALLSSIQDARGNVVRQNARVRSFSSPNSVDVGTINVGSVPSGRYTLVYRVLRDSVEEVAKTSKTFYVYNPHIQPRAVSASSMKASEMAGLTLDELGEEFQRARYLSTEQEKASFAKLTTAEARREFLAMFWESVERGRPGFTPITRMAYLQRVVTANLKYRVHSREGWQSDRGRVYLLYGDPDDIERVPSNEDTKPYEIWYYNQIESGVQFIFIDRTGFGEYILGHSTKRGELRDEGWQRLLQ